LKPGSFDSEAIVAFLKELKKHFRGFHVTLIWDGLAAHRSAVTKEFLEKEKRWLTVERLPAYAPDLNPVEYAWSNLKSNELANNCADDIAEAAASTVGGLKRIKRSRSLPFSFLEHAGLSF
jgi:transposase